MLSIPSAMHSWPECSQKPAQPVFIRVGISHSQLLFGWLRPSFITLLVYLCCLPSSPSAHYPLWPLLTMVSRQAETTSEQWREERVWDTERALELALDAGTRSRRRWGLPGSRQNARLSYSSALPTHKGNEMPFEQQGWQSPGFLEKRGCLSSPDVFCSPSALTLIPLRVRGSSGVHEVELNTCWRAGHVHTW